MTFADEDGTPYQFTWRTIQTWLSRYKKAGITDMLRTRRRGDSGKPRKVSPEQLLEAIEAVKPLFRDKRLMPNLLYKACVEKGLLRREDVSRTSFYRIVRGFDLLKPDEQTQSKKRLAFAKAHANDMWQADTLCGPYVKIKGKSVPTKLIAFIDDASRVVAHGQFFAVENVDTLIQAFRSALYKRGLPMQLYVDYVARNIINIMCPTGFGLDLKRIRFLPPDPANDELFFLEQDRHVSKTNNFQLHKYIFEAPVDLRNQKVQVRYNRLDFEHSPVVVYFKNQRMGLATVLDRVANDRQRDAGPNKKGTNAIGMQRHVVDDDIPF